VTGIYRPSAHVTPYVTPDVTKCLTRAHLRVTRVPSAYMLAFARLEASRAVFSVDARRATHARRSGVSDADAKDHGRDLPARVGLLCRVHRSTEPGSTDRHPAPCGAFRSRTEG
jgi:hypothetical protein